MGSRELHGSFPHAAGYRASALLATFSRRRGETRCTRSGRFPFASRPGRLHARPVRDARLHAAASPTRPRWWYRNVARNALAPYGPRTAPTSSARGARRAAATMLRSLAAAVSSSLTQRLAKQPKPQSGLRKICSGRKYSRAPLDARDDLRRVLGLGGARVDARPGRSRRSPRARPTTSMSPARGVAYSSTNWSTRIARKAGSSCVVVPGEQHVLVAAPVAAADVQAGAHARRRPRRPRLSSSAAYSSSAPASRRVARVAHMKVRRSQSSRHDDLGQHRLVELHERRSPRPRSSSSSSRRMRTTSSPISVLSA